MPEASIRSSRRDKSLTNVHVIRSMNTSSPCGDMITMSMIVEYLRRRYPTASSALVLDALDGSEKIDTDLYKKHNRIVVFDQPQSQQLHLLQDYYYQIEASY